MRNIHIYCAMLLTFTVSNFRSIREEQTLNMVASNGFKDHAGHLISAPGNEHKVLPVAVFYGANGAGKSNLVKAISFALNMIGTGSTRDSKIPQDAFCLGNPKAVPSKFEFRFVSDGRTFNYGFEYDSERIRAEWLDEIIGQKVNSLYERETLATGEVEVDLSKQLADESAKLKAFASIGGRANQLFLTAVMDQLDAPNRGGTIASVVGWFSRIQVIYPDTRLPGLATHLHHEESLRDFINEFVRNLRVGPESFSTRESAFDGFLDEATESKIIAGLRSRPDSVYRLTTGGGQAVVLELSEEGRLVRRDVIAKHRTESGDEVEMSMDQQSDGTIRLTELLPSLHTLRKGEGIFIIDEFDRSLHPLLAWTFIKAFTENAGKRGAQMILTTHETHLLDLELLRRDEIWFAEKNHSQATEIYPLSEFKQRTDADVAKRYLQGRFGAIPFLGGIERLFPQTLEPVEA